MFGYLTLLVYLKIVKILNKNYSKKILQMLLNLKIFINLYEMHSDVQNFSLLAFFQRDFIDEALREQ